MDRPHHVNSTSHTHSTTYVSSSPASSSSTNKSYKSSKRKDATTPDGKHDQLGDRRGKSGSNWNSRSSSGSGKPKVTTPIKSPSSSSSNLTGSQSNDGPSPNGNNPSRYHHRDVPPRFQLYGNGKHNKHTTIPPTTVNGKTSQTRHSTQGNSKKSSSNINSHWSTEHAPDMTWNPTSDNEATPIEGGQNPRLYSRTSSNPWSTNNSQTSSNRDQPYYNDASNWNTSQEDFDPTQTNSDKMCSHLEELEIIDGGPSHDGNGHQRLRNFDSDAMKDGVSSSSQVIGGGEDPLDGGSVTEGGLWRGHISRSSMGSSSSVNSAGSNSSWKGGANSSNNGGRSSSTGNYQRSASPRKHGKYDNNTNRSLSTSGGKPPIKHSIKPKKSVVEIDEAMDSLQGEPSGWGNLPSPKPTDVDTGTDVWGIPDDIKQKMKKEVSTRNGWTDNSHTDDWNPSSSRGTTPSNWGDVGKSLGNVNGSGQWGNTGGDPSWTTSTVTPPSPYLFKPNEKGVGFSDNVKLLVDMGFSVQDSENVLKRNNNNFESTLGDLLALASVKEEDVPPDLSPSNFPLPGPAPRGLMTGKDTSNRLSPSLSHSGGSGGPSPRTTSPSFVQFTKDQSFQMSGSTPATPTLSASSTHNHLIQQVGVMPPKLPRSNSLPQGRDLSSINTPYVQKVLTQQLKDRQVLKQQLINQLKTLQSPKHQQMLTVRLNQVNSNIMILDRQLVLTNHLAMQQKQQRGNSNEERNGTMGHHEPPNTPSSSTTLSPPDVFSSVEVHVPSTDVNTGGDHNTETRSVSKLQRIISSGGSQELMPPDVFQGTDVFDPSISSTTVAPTLVGPSSYSNIDSYNDTIVSSSIPTQSSPAQNSLTSSGKFTRSVDEIPEFKPGVPWNPGSSTGTGTGNASSNSRKFVSQRSSDGSRRPDSITLSGSGSTNVPYSMDTMSDNDFYHQDPMSHNYPNSPHLSSQQFQRAGTSPGGIGQSNTNPPRGAGYRSASGGNYSGFGNTGSGYYTRQQSGGQAGYQPRPSPGTPTSQMFPPSQFNSSNTGSRNQRQRLYSQQPTVSGGLGGGYNEGGAPQRKGFDSGGRKWSFDGSNPWGVPEKSGTSIWSVESSNESMLSPSIESEPAVFSPAMEWRAPIRKPSLPVQLTAPTNCILLKNLSPQVDEISIREVCSEFGFVQNCTLNTMTGSALVFYQSKEEAMQAKLGLEKNPIICGISVQPSFATEKTISSIIAQRTPGHAPYNPHPSPHVESAPAWLPSPESLISPSKTPLQPSRIGSVGSSSNNRSTFVSTIPTGPGRHNNQPKKDWSRDQFTAPGGPTPSSSSVWNSGGILPGISNAWSTQSNTANNSMDPEDTVSGTSPSMSTFLPNGLF